MKIFRSAVLIAAALSLPLVATPSFAALDELSATLDGKAIQKNETVKVVYNHTYTIVGTSKWNAKISYATSDPAVCALNGDKISILKSSGSCTISVASAGVPGWDAVTNNYKLKVGNGKTELQGQLLTLVTTGKVGGIVTLPASTNVGQKVTYKLSSTKNCKLNGNMVDLLKRGSCYIHASAPGVSGTYKSFRKTFTVKIKAA